MKPTLLLPPPAELVMLMLRALIVCWRVAEPTMPALPPGPPAMSISPLTLTAWAPPFVDTLMSAPLPLPLGPPVSRMLAALTVCCPLLVWKIPADRLVAGARPPVMLIMPDVETVCAPPTDEGLL